MVELALRGGGWTQRHISVTAKELANRIDATNKYR